MLLGPLFRFELVRLARRGTHLPLRVVLAVLLFVGLLTSYLRLFPDADVIDLLFGGAEAANPSHLDQFAETFLLAFLVIQHVAVLLLTPVYAGGAIAEEKEKGRFDFLLTAPLGRWELVVGKLAARLVFVLAVILTGFPVLSFTLLFGGVDPGRVLAGFAVAVVTAVVVGSFSVMLSVLRSTLRDVLVWVCFWLAASGVVGLLASFTSRQQVGGVLSPVTVLIPLFEVWHDPPRTGDPTWSLVGTYAGVFLPLAGVFVLVAVAKVRTVVARTAVSPTSAIPPPEAVPPPDLVRPSDPPLPEWYKLPERPAFAPDEVPSAADGRGFLVPALGDSEDPLVWKERYFSARLPLLEGQWFAVVRGCALFAFLFVLGAILFIGLVTSLTTRLSPGVVTNGVARVVFAVATLAVPFAGVRATTSVAEERAKKTLDSLFALPIDRSAILWAKFQAAAFRSRWWVFGIAVAALLALLTGGLNPLCLLSIPLLIFGYGTFTLGLGVWLGVWCKTGVRAVLTHIAVTLVTLFGPLFLMPFSERLAFGLSPPTAMAVGAVTLSESFDSWEGMSFCLSFPVGVLYFWAGWLLWRLALVRFERFGRD